MGKNNGLAEQLAEKIAKKGISQAEAARQMGISSASISMILSGKHEGLTGIWNKVELWLGKQEGGWKTAETANFLMIQDLCRDAQLLSQARAISFKPGSGKTHAARHYAHQHAEAFYFNCESAMSKPRLLKTICRNMGLQESWNMEEMLDNIIDKLGNMNRPLLIFDEFDELSEKALRIFKDLYNRVRCGFLLVGGVGLQKRIMLGAKNAKQSYQEILSRLGGEFIPLTENNLGTTKKICQANGMAEVEQIQAIHKQSAGDLRAVKALLEALKIQEQHG